MQNTLPWVIAGLCGLAMLSMLAAMVLRRRQARRKALPTEWALTARPVFSADERLVFRLLREALPHHVIMAKLPLVRFCQPTEADNVRYWYDLLGGVSVNFAICSPNGRVLAAVDLETERPATPRSLRIKQEVLAACRIRYLRSSADNMPTASELQLLVPFSNLSSRSPQPLPARGAPMRMPPAPAAAASQASLSTRRAPPRNTLWNESPVFSDSFFAPDSRFDSFAPSELPPSMAMPLAPLPAPLSEPRPRGYRPRGAGSSTDADHGGPSFADSAYPHHPLHDPAQDAPQDSDIAGIVVDTPRYQRR